MDIAHPTHLLPLGPNHFLDFPQEVRERPATPLPVASTGRGASADDARALVDDMVRALRGGWGPPTLPHRHVVRRVSTMPMTGRVGRHTATPNAPAESAAVILTAGAHGRERQVNRTAAALSAPCTTVTGATTHATAAEAATGPPRLYRALRPSTAGSGASLNSASPHSATVTLGAVLACVGLEASARRRLPVALELRGNRS